MYVASYFEKQEPNPKSKYDSWLLKHEPMGERIKPIIEKLQGRVDSKQIKDCVIWETKTFYRIEETQKKK